MPEVRAADGRSWTVRREISWAKPAADREFEHDVAAGQVAGIALLVLVIVMVLITVLGAPPGVVFPAWLKLTFIAMMLLLPAEWVLSRPWTIVAQTYEPIETAGEHWVGTVHGFLAARQETAFVVQHLEEHGRPDDGRGALLQVH